jgi:hypothetical protein
MNRPKRLGKKEYGNTVSKTKDQLYTNQTHDLPIYKYNFKMSF